VQFAAAPAAYVLTVRSVAAGCVGEHPEAGDDPADQVAVGE
jgi:hypothetical protein